MTKKDELLIRAEAALEAIENVEKIILETTYASSDNALKPVIVFRVSKAYKKIEALKKRYKEQGRIKE